MENSKENYLKGQPNQKHSKMTQAQSLYPSLSEGSSKPKGAKKFKFKTMLSDENDQYAYEVLNFNHFVCCIRLSLIFKDSIISKVIQ